MNPAAHLPRMPELDDPWKRLPWVVIAALLLWAGLLAAFALMLERSQPPGSEPKPLEARIVELPPKPAAGLAAGTGASAPAAPAPAKPKTRPAHVPPAVHHKEPETPPPPPSDKGATSPSDSAQAPAAPEGATAEEKGRLTGESTGEQAVTGTGGGTGIGTDSLGARAIYTPMPEIPDDLREDAIQTVAVAHFKVTSGGQVSVSLTTETANPRLNQILLDTLQQWRFFPATKDGAPIDSEFDVRIPISVQ